MDHTPKYERIGKLIYGVQRLGGVGNLLTLEGDPRVTPELASVARQLAERHQRLMKPIEEKRVMEDPEVDGILRDVPELYATLVDALGHDYLMRRSLEGGAK